MGTKTGIEWTDATWNPMTGCTRISAGCDHCYAATVAERRTRCRSWFSLCRACHWTSQMERGVGRDEHAIRMRGGNRRADRHPVGSSSSAR